MAFDGARALVVGDYITPASGEHAGQLGPWSGVLEATGLAPRSTPVKVAFVVYGTALVGLAAAFAARASWAWGALLVGAALGLWYIPFGTLLNGAILVLLLTALRPRRS